MSDWYWSYLIPDDVLYSGTWVLMVLMVIGLAVWFACSIAENTAKMGRQIRRPDYEALLRENGRLRGSLANAREENDYLRKLYRGLPPRVEEDDGRKAA